MVIIMAVIDYEQFRDIVCRTCWKKEDVGCHLTEQEIRGCFDKTFEYYEQKPSCIAVWGIKER